MGERWRRWGRELSGGVQPWLTSAIPMENPYCSCKLTRRAGRADLAIGALRDDDGFADWGAVYIMFLSGEISDNPCSADITTTVVLGESVVEISPGVDIPLHGLSTVPCFGCVTWDSNATYHPGCFV